MIWRLEQRAAVRILMLVLLVAGLMAVVSLLASRPALAEPFTVTNTSDPGDGNCSPTLGCTLREAINAANGTSGTDVIRFNILGEGSRPSNRPPSCPR